VLENYRVPLLGYCVALLCDSTLAILRQYQHVTDGWTDRHTTTAYTALA